MPWRNILTSGGYNAALYALRSNAGYSAVYNAIRGHFPDEELDQIREATRRAIESYNTAQQLNRSRRERPIPLDEIPGLTGSRRTDLSPDNCQVRYGLTVGILDESTGQVIHRRIPEVNADHTLSVSELRDIADQVIRDYWNEGRLYDTNEGDGSNFVLSKLTVDFVWRC